MLDAITLHQIKRDTHKISSYYGETLKVVCEAKILGCNGFWDKDVVYSVENEGKCKFFNLENEIFKNFFLRNLGKKKSKMIICCQCLFDTYLLKINKEEDLFKTYIVMTQAIGQKNQMSFFI